jgi:Protein of unknown function (DUF1569)
METLFDPVSYREVLRRVESIQSDSPRQWGKMTVAQMLEHAARTLEIAAGKKELKQAFLGKMIGWIFWKGFVGPKPFQRNVPSLPDFVVQGEPDFGATKEKLKTLLGEFHALDEQGCDRNIHGFFGRMTSEEWGVTQYKHMEHHLRQFGA